MAEYRGNTIDFSKEIDKYFELGYDSHLYEMIKEQEIDEQYQYMVNNKKIKHIKIPKNNLHLIKK